MTDGTPADFWDRRYGEPGWAYGTEPNDFLRAEAAGIPPGKVLCLAEGEGRNAVHLAALGHEVEAVDQSAAGLAKLQALAARRGVSVTAHRADLADFPMGQARWQGIVSIFVHLPMPLRRRVHGRAVEALAPGGVLLLEAYGPAQLELGTGGPREPGRLASLQDLRQDLQGLELLICREIRREVREGTYHAGTGDVIQILGRKP